MHPTNDIPGWLSDTEGDALERLADGKDALEIGSYCGRSTVRLATSARSVLTVDTFDGRCVPDHRGTIDALKANLERYGVLGKVRIFAGESYQLSDVGPFDLAFIDGSHDRQSVLADAAICQRFLRDGGMLAIHDYRTVRGEHDGRWDEGVTDAVNELLASGYETIERAGTVIVIRRTHAD